MNDKKSSASIEAETSTGKACDSKASSADRQPRRVIQKKVEIAGQWAVLAQVADACELPRETINEAAEKGAVWWQKSMGVSKSGEIKYKNPVRIRCLDQQISSADLVLVNYNPTVLAAQAFTPTLVSDQVNYSIWNKPSGMLSQGSKWSDHTTITYQVEKIHAKRALLVHRLDRAASGLMVIAHTKNAITALADLFSMRRVEKTYRVMVLGEYWQRVPQQIELPVDDKPAHTEIISAEVNPARAGASNGDLHLSTLMVKIHSGRKHQIRSHLSSIGYPVAGDRLFNPHGDHDRDLQLACVALKFECPFTDRQQTFTLPESLGVLS